MSNFNTNLKVGFPSIWAPTDQKAPLCIGGNILIEWPSLGWGPWGMPRDEWADRSFPGGWNTITSLNYFENWAKWRPKLNTLPPPIIRFNTLPFLHLLWESSTFFVLEKTKMWRKKFSKKVTVKSRKPCNIVSDGLTFCKSQ